jgi:hypothetical protein
MHRGLFTTRGTDIFVPMPDTQGPAGRSISDVILEGKVTLPEPDIDMLTDWSLAYGSSEPGTIEAAGPRTRLGQNNEIQAIEAAALTWPELSGLEDAVAEAHITPLVCQGASFHTDGFLFGDFIFLVVWLVERQGIDLFFPNGGKRIALDYGSVVLFDPAQPHGLVFEEKSTWDAFQYTSRMSDPTQHFVSFDFPVTTPSLAQRLGIRFHPQDPTQAWTDKLRVDNRPVEVDPSSGHWKFTKDVD